MRRNRPRDRATLQPIALLAVFLLICAQVQADDTDASARLQALKTDLRWPDYRWETVREDAGYLVKKHGVSEAELLEAAKASEKLGWEWHLLLVVGTKEAKTAFAEWYAALSDRAASNAGVGLNRWTMASPDLSAALLPYVEEALPALRSRKYKRALGVIAMAPIPEALPVLEQCFLHLDPYYAKHGAEGLGRLSSPAALAALERCWLNRRRLEHGTLCALSGAIGSYGDEGVKVLRRIYAAKRHQGYISYALRKIATKDALKFAGEIAADHPDDVNSQAGLLRVTAAVGGPDRDAALLKAMSSDEGFIREEAFSLLRELKEPASRIVREAVVRTALTPGDPLARHALAVLGTWHCLDDQRKKAATPWGKSVDGISISAGQVNYHGGREKGYITCHLRIRNEGNSSVRIALGARLWALLADGEPSLRQLQHPEAGVHDTIVHPGSVLSTSTSILIVPIPFEARRPIRFKTRLTVQEKDYKRTKGWVGSVLSPEFEFYVLPPGNTHDLAHWREFLSKARETGRLPSGGSISWTGFSMQGTTIDPEAQGVATVSATSRGEWLALPDGLRVLDVDEVKRIAGYLLEDDRFANAIDWYDGPIGKYMPRAEVRLESASRRGTWGQFHFKEDVRKALESIVNDLLQPRLSEARKRLGIPDPDQHPTR